MENKPEIIEYKKCPVCGGEETLIASLAAKEIVKGVNPSSLPQCLTSIPFVMRNPRSQVFIGSRAVAGNVLLEMCKGCGIIRAVRVEIGEAMALNIPPNRG